MEYLCIKSFNKRYEKGRFTSTYEYLKHTDKDIKDLLLESTEYLGTNGWIKAIEERVYYDVRIS